MKNIVKLLILISILSCQDNNVASETSQQKLSDADIEVQTKAAESTRSSDFAPFSGHPIYKILSTDSWIDQMTYFQDVLSKPDTKNRVFILGSLMEAILSNPNFNSNVDSNHLTVFLNTYFELPIKNPNLLLLLVEAIENSGNVEKVSLEKKLLSNADFINGMLLTINNMPASFDETNSNLNLQALELNDVKARYNIE